MKLEIDSMLLYDKSINHFKFAAYCVMIFVDSNNFVERSFML